MSYSVGRVAAFAGVTVRTLHHYDRAGLLSPGGRSGAGYRLYGDADLARLQQILFYRELGFSLDEIAAILRDPQANALEHRDCGRPGTRSPWPRRTPSPPSCGKRAWAFGAFPAARGRKAASRDGVNCCAQPPRYGAGLRGIVQAGSARLAVDADGVLTVGDLPHALLFLRVAAVVQHAGAGTSAAALRAGAPSVPVPVTADQPGRTGCTRSVPPPPRSPSPPSPPGGSRTRCAGPCGSRRTPVPPRSPHGTWRPRTGWARC